MTKGSLNERISKMYANLVASSVSYPVDTSTKVIAATSVSYKVVTSKMLVATTEIIEIATSIPVESTTKQISTPVVFLSPTTVANDTSFRTWLIAILAIIAFCLIFVVIGMIACVFFCYKRCCKQKKAAQSYDQSPKITEIEEPVVADVKTTNRKSAAETIYMSVQSSFHSDPEISDDLSISEDEVITEPINIRRNNTFSILD
jgi:hypothetical protein